MPPAPTRMRRRAAGDVADDDGGRRAGDARHVVVLGQPVAVDSPTARRGGRGRACCGTPARRRPPSTMGERSRTENGITPPSWHASRGASRRRVPPQIWRAFRPSVRMRNDIQFDGHHRASLDLYGVSALTASDAAHKNWPHLRHARKTSGRGKAAPQEDGMRRLIAGLCVVLVGLSAPAYAQRTTGTIIGAVTDESGAVLPGVTVTLTGAGVAGSPTSITTETGTYRFTSLPPGNTTSRSSFRGSPPSTARKWCCHWPKRWKSPSR